MLETLSSLTGWYFILIPLSLLAQTTHLTLINVKEHGVRANGKSDDTFAIQQLLNQKSRNSIRRLYFPAGVYLTGPLFIKSKTDLVFTSQTVFQAKNNFNSDDRLLNVIGEENVRIFGNGGKIQMSRSDYLEGEQRFGIWLNNAQEIDIQDLVAQTCGGDGFCIGGIDSKPCKNVTIRNCESIDCRRNGLSIINGLNINVIGGKYIGSKGTAPNYGIDIEPDNERMVVNNITLENVVTSHNFGGGIAIVLSALGINTGSKSPCNICLENCTSNLDGERNDTYSAALYLHWSHSILNKLTGTVLIKKEKILNPYYQPILLREWNDAVAPRVLITNTELNGRPYFLNN